MGSALVRVEDVSAQICLCLVHVGLHGIPGRWGSPAVSAWRISSCAAMAFTWISGIDDVSVRALTSRFPNGSNMNGMNMFVVACMITS